MITALNQQPTIISMFSTPRITTTSLYLPFKRKRTRGKIVGISRKSVIDSSACGIIKKRAKMCWVKCSTFPPRHAHSLQEIKCLWSAAQCSQQLLGVLQSAKFFRSLHLLIPRCVGYGLVQFVIEINTFLSVTSPNSSHMFLESSNFWKITMKSHLSWWHLHILC